jgi:hypothetical protein
MLHAHQEWGDRFVEHLHGMFAFVIAERDSGRVLMGRDRLGIKPLYLAEDGTASGSRPPCRPCCAAAGSTPRSTRWRCTTTSPSTPWCPLPGPSSPGVRKLPPATTLAIEPDGRRQETTYWSPLRARSGPGRLERARLGGRHARRPAHRGGAPARRRRARGLPALGGPRLQPHRGAARRGRPARPGHLLHRLRVGRRARGRRVQVLRRHRPTSSRPTTTRSASTPGACCPPSATPSAP